MVITRPVWPARYNASLPTALARVKGKVWGLNHAAYWLSVQTNESTLDCRDTLMAACGIVAPQPKTPQHVVTPTPHPRPVAPEPEVMRTEQKGAHHYKHGRSHN